MAIFTIKVLTGSDNPKDVIRDYTIQGVTKLFVKGDPIVGSKGRCGYNGFKIILGNYIDKDGLELTIKTLQKFSNVFKKKYEIIVIIAFEKENSNEELVIENNDLRLLYGLGCEINIYYE